MAFTAIHPEHGLLDATQGLLGRNLDWSLVYRAKPRVPMACPECGHGVHGKRSPRKVRYFAHDPGRPADCSLSNESMEHHLMKLEMATAIRAAGWHAELEVGSPDGSWRADVMAFSPEGDKRMAWEAQLSPITVEDIRFRTSRYDEAGIRVCWVTDRRSVPWMGAVPSVRTTAPEEGSGWVLDDGVAGFDTAASRWVFQTVDLTGFIRWALLGFLFPYTALPRYSLRSQLMGGGSVHRGGNLVWTSTKSVTEQAESEQRRLVKEAEDQRRRALETKRKAAAAQRKAAADRKRAEELAAARMLQEERAALARAQVEKDRREALARQSAERRRFAEERARLQAEETARIQRETAAREERERRAKDTAELWWGLLSVEQSSELMAAVQAQSWDERGLRVEQRGPAGGTNVFAYGIPVHTVGRQRTLYAIVRPCPDLLELSPQVLSQQVFVRNDREAQLLVARGMDPDRVTHFDLPDHEQVTLWS